MSRMDLNRLAAKIVRESTEPESRRPDEPASSADAARAARRRGGVAGGRSRAAKLTPEQRSESARRAAQARWGKS
jgi:hypothetical protein